MNKLILSLVILMLIGCAAGPTASRNLHSGQWTNAQNIGPDTFLVEGFSTQDAVNGAQSHCTNMGRQFSMIQLMPHTSSLRATIIFRCN